MWLENGEGKLETLSDIVGAVDRNRYESDAEISPILPTYVT